MVKIKKINYGIDGINVIRWLLITSLVASMLFVYGINVNVGAIKISYKIFFYIALGLYAQVLLSLVYAKFGKFRQRERILNSYTWRGDEKVLDIGCGLGLLLIGAAKKLKTGKAYGIDIWSTSDLSNNSLENAMQNATLENVANKVDITSQNILKTNFANNSFDVIVSNLCLHNIYSKSGRETAYKEITRILKPGGTVILSDYKNNSQIANFLLDAGLNQKIKSTSYFDVFPPLTIQKFVKAKTENFNKL